MEFILQMHYVKTVQECDATYDAMKNKSRKQKRKIICERKLQKRLLIGLIGK